MHYWPIWQTVNPSVRTADFPFGFQTPVVSDLSLVLDRCSQPGKPECYR